MYNIQLLKSNIFQTSLPKQVSKNQKFNFNTANKSNEIPKDTYLSFKSGVKPEGRLKTFTERVVIAVRLLGKKVTGEAATKALPNAEASSTSHAIAIPDQVQGGNISLLEPGVRLLVTEWNPEERLLYHGGRVGPLDVDRAIWNNLDRINSPEGGEFDIPLEGIF